MFGVGAAAEGSLCRYPAISADLMLPPSLPSRCAARLSVPYWSQCPSRPYTLPRQWPPHEAAARQVTACRGPHRRRF